MITYLNVEFLFLFKYSYSYVTPSVFKLLQFKYPLDPYTKISKYVRWVIGTNFFTLG